MSTAHPHSLSDRDLVDEVARLATSERGTTADLIAHLAELYARRLHVRAGYGSLFTYCLEVLGMSESAAYDRMKAAKLARRFPVILGSLDEGRVNLTTVRLVAPHHPRLQPAVSTAAPAIPPVLCTSEFPDAADVPPPVPSPPRNSVRPLAPERYPFTFTASAAVREKFELTQDLLRHAIPSGDPAQAMARVLDLAVEELVRRKFAATEKPHPRRGQGENSRNIPAEVKRAVYIRDRGRCAYLAPEGRGCGARGFVEFHEYGPCHG
jgi:hypothetical protein